MADVNHFDFSGVYPEDWAAALQTELDEPNKWKDICNVEFTDSRVLHNPYFTDLTVYTGSRGTPYTPQAVTETDESVTYSTYKWAAYFIDRADLIQSDYSKMMYLAQRQGVQLNEAIESAMYATHASFTDFGSEDLAGSTGSTAITVTDTNVSDIINILYQRILENNGASILERNGAFIVWTPYDFTQLRNFAAANGFSSADKVLSGGTTNPSSGGGFDYLGFTHYTSNLLTSGHVFAGVKKVLHLGILRGTYGDVNYTNDPNNVSGIGIVSRVDYGFKVWTKVKPLLYDVNVSA